MPPAAILDVDGTLVDTNYQHAIAWYRALRRNGIVLLGSLEELRGSLDETPLGRR